MNSQLAEPSQNLRLTGTAMPAHPDVGLGLTVDKVETQAPPAIKRLLDITHSFKTRATSTFFTKTSKTSLYGLEIKSRKLTGLTVEQHSTFYHPRHHTSTGLQSLMLTPMI